MRRRWPVMVLTVVCASLLCARGVEAAWAVITTNGGSSFAAGSIAAPSGLAVTHLTSPRSNGLSWTLPPASQQGTAQTVSSRVDGGAYAALATLSGSATSYTDGSALGDTLYCYMVTTTWSQWNAATAASCPAASAPLQAIDAGGAAAASYVADAGYSGGTTYVTGAAVDTSLVPNPAPQTVYRTERYGNFTYTVSGLTANTVYQVRLQEAEIYWSGAGKRAFDVRIQGVQVLTNYDIFRATGGKDRAIALTFSTVSDGSGAIAIQFVTLKDNAKVSGIEIL
ncbi:MAG: malectin domain-containing carbohydrate-binding protein [Candidatus Dormibacteria bacterium]